MKRFNGFGRWLSKEKLLIPFSIVVLLPLGMFILEALLTMNVGMLKNLLNPRTMVLMYKTFFYSVMVSVLCVFFGGIFSAMLIRTGQVVRRLSITLLLVMIPIPSTVYALMWIELIGRLGRQTMRQTGWGISLLIQAMYMMPMSILLIYIGMRRLPKVYQEAGWMLASPLKVFFKIWLPSCRPFFMMSGLTLFVLTINDYSIPSSFSVNTYSMEIFAKYSISLSSGEAFVAGLPLMVLCFLALIPASRILSESYIFEGSDQSLDKLQRRSTLRDGIVSFITIVAVGVLILPLAVFISQVDLKEFMLVARTSSGEIIFTLIVCIFSGLIAIPIMWMAALYIKEHRKKLWLVLLPLALSPSLIGAALIQVMNQTLFRSIYLSPLMLIYANMIRFMPIGIIILLLGINYLSEDYFAIAYMKGDRIGKIYKQVILPLMFPFFLVAAGSITLLGLGELGTSVMVMPPGYSTITVKIYGYLHYGASEKIAGMSLWVIFIICVLTVLIRPFLKKVVKGTQ